MPEPNTASAPEEPDEPGRSTAGWTQPAPARSRDPSDAETATRTIPSTPAPGDPARYTLSENTDRLSPVNSDGSPRPPDIPGYRVEQIVGRGGMGVVYRAVDLTLNRVVALKVLHPGGRDPRHVLGRFDREVKALAEIDHPNIVRIYDADYWHGFPYFTMQFVPGGPLSRQMARFRGDHRASARLIAKVARAVQVLHDRKVIHRDLKPLNILLGAGDEPLVADFGLAKWLDEDPQADCSATGHPLGTRQYMAPEQTLGKKTEYSAACDVWSIGVVLYELLAGRRPFVDDGKSELFKRIREEPPPPLPPQVPAELAAVVEKCLAKAPADRYATAAAVADDLEAWLEGRPVSVRPARPTSRWALAAALAALAALIALPALTMVGGAPAPPPKKTVAERVADGETVYLTDKFGKPTVPTTPVLGQVLQETRDGWHVFVSKWPGMLRLLDEPLPRPLRVEGEIAVGFREAEIPFKYGGVYVGEKEWLGGPVAHSSAVRLFVAPFGDTPNNRPPSIRTSLWLHRWSENGIRTIKLQNADSAWGNDPYKHPEPRFVPVRIDIRDGVLTATSDGHQFRPVRFAEMLTQFRRDVETDPRLANYPFAQPVLGDGIGVTVNDAELIVRNLRVARSDP